MFQRNKLVELFESLDRNKRHVTECADWHLFRNCPRACLLQTQIRLEPHIPSSEHLFADLLKKALVAWHKTQNRAVAEAVLQAGVQHRGRRLVPLHKHINSGDILMEYIHYDERNRLRKQGWLIGEPVLPVLTPSR